MVHREFALVDEGEEFRTESQNLLA